MLRWLKRILVGSPTIEFESAFDLTESVVRLRAATKKSVFSAMAHEHAVGTVKETRVSLQRVIPMVGNSFKPFFVGRFAEKDGEIVLRGNFRMLWVSKLFMALWFAILLLITIAIIANGIYSQKFSTDFPIIIGLLGGGIGIVRLGQWFSRKDQVWLSNVIRAALGTTTVQSQFSEPSLSRPIDLPLHLWAFASLVVFGGLLMLISGVTGVQTFQFHISGTVLTRFEDGSQLRYLVILSGGAMMAWAYGIFRRHFISWWAGFGLLGCGEIDAIQRVTVLQPTTIVFAIIPSLIIVFWGWWWYVQKVHFQNRPFSTNSK